MKKRMNDLGKFRCKLFVLAALWLVGATGAFAQKKTLAIVDAGSSGSRLYVYAVDKSAKTVKECCPSEDLRMKLSDVITKDSVSKFYNSIHIPEIEGGQPAELYILATAGMRQNSDSANVYSLLNENAPSSLKKAMTISGRYEGLYAWMASNYDRLSTAKAASGCDLLDPPLNGILEIGGASLQITFVPKAGAVTAVTDTIRHPAYGVIYSKSYLGGGVNGFGENRNKKKVMDGLQTVKGGYGASGLIARGGIPKACLENKPPRTPADTVKFNYVKKVLEEMAAVVEPPVAASDASWTKGAAYDIGINGREPEEYDYAVDN